MAEFLAITFDTDQAEAALKSVRALESGGQIGLEDTAVVPQGRRRQGHDPQRGVHRHRDGRRRRGGPRRRSCS